jgi:Uma2 family endonuclease
MEVTMSLLTTPKPPVRRSFQKESYVPPLENGDRLTRAEFERRYHAMPTSFRAELIEGVVAVASPVRFNVHGEQHAELLHWLMLYRDGTPGIRCADNATERLDLDNEPQPDVCLLIDPARGGNVKIDADGYIEGAPELVAEVAASSVSLDLGPKLNAYRRNGVREYIVWRVQDNEIDWFIHREGRFDRLQPGTDGITRSETYPGLWLDAPALIQGDLPRVHAVLRQGLASAEHEAFVSKLATTDENDK